MPKRRSKGEGSVRFRWGRWWLRYYRDGDRVEQPTDCASKSEALTMLRENTARPLVVPTGRTPLRELHRDMVANYERNGRGVAEIHKRWAHLELVFGGDVAADITTDRLSHYADQRLDEGAAPATINREFACLRRMLRLGAKATPRKVGEVPAFPMLRENNVRTGFFERGEFEAVRKALPEHLRVMVTVAYWMGWRRTELLNLTWSQIELDRGAVRLEPGTTKNRDGRVAYLPPEPLRMLRAWRKATTAAEKKQGKVIRYVFHRDGRRIGFEFYDAWREACRAAGLVETTEDGRERALRRLHDFRRTAGRNYIRSFVPERVAMQILGHKTRAMFDRYHIVNEADLATAAERVAAPNPPPMRAAPPTKGSTQRRTAARKAARE